MHMGQMTIPLRMMDAFRPSLRASLLSSNLLFDMPQMAVLIQVHDEQGAARGACRPLQDA